MWQPFLSSLSKFSSFASEFEDVPFVEFLVKNDLKGNLRQYIIHCIAMVDETTPTIKVCPI